MFTNGLTCCDDGRISAFSLQWKSSTSLSYFLFPLPSPTLSFLPLLSAKLTIGREGVTKKGGNLGRKETDSCTRVLFELEDESESTTGIGKEGVKQGMACNTDRCYSVKSIGMST